jgi:hypothetical protein
MYPRAHTGAGTPVALSKLMISVRTQVTLSAQTRRTVHLIAHRWTCPSPEAAGSTMITRMWKLIHRCVCVSSFCLPHPRVWEGAKNRSDVVLNTRVFVDASLPVGSLSNEIADSLQITNGVNIGEGDGTVSLMSLGGMCVEGWKRKRWNPAGIKIITHEVRPHIQS